jgi:hydroxyacylglutathione hydrolase
MPLVFEQILTEGIAELSYLLGDDSEGVAAVIDPTPDVEKYVELARQKGLSITHIFETHIHADLVSGARELCARVGSAKIYASGEGDARYGFDLEKINDGEQFTFGDTVLSVKHTPGHTPEHVSYLIAEKKHADTPWGVMTGDSLFVNSAGRPDLLGSDETKKLAEQQFHTLRDFYLKLPDSVIIYPNHGSGSPCGADIGDRLDSTIGYERQFNPFLQFKEVASFTDYALSTAPPVPKYYPLMKKLNAEGPEVLGKLPRVPGLPPKAFKQALSGKAGILVDTRPMLGFGGGHIAGAFNIGAMPILSIWAGWLLDPEVPLLLVLESDADLEKVVTLFLRTGYSKFGGYLVGGMEAWVNSGHELTAVKQKTVHQVHEAGDALQIVDVRAPSEWESGHVPGAHHIFLPDLREHLGNLDRQRPIVAYCDSGYRASIATSILKQEGFADVSNVPGSWQAWQKAGLPIQGKSE